ncbi:ABC transporter permease [Kaistia sp. 32K]|uniref:ABC transporter permease n=1 Tax=Kaistia sp. 32K TaxID=2795690 RepID=UPI001915A988|nr:ABC transporter permease [Kaistia sp. 32K]
MANLQNPDAGRLKRRGLSSLAFDELGIALAVLLFFVVGAFSSPYFLTLNNLTGILQNVTFLGFLSIGVGLTLMAGEIDISVGSIFGLSSIVTALVLKADYPLAVAIAAGLSTGLVCGLVNGVVAEIIKVPVVVITLATLGVYRALALVLANGSPVGGLPEIPGFFEWFGQGGIGQISYITLLFLAVAVIVEIVLRWTSSGFRLLAIGSNPHAAHLIGFHVERTRITVLAFSGLMAGLSGVCAVAYLQTASPTSGTGYELAVLAAIIIGGVKLTGGRGSILGVLLGLCVIGVIQNLIVLWGISPNWSQGVSGLVLIAAMTLTWITKRGASQRG